MTMIVCFIFLRNTNNNCDILRRENHSNAFIKLKQIVTI